MQDLTATASSGKSQQAFGITILKKSHGEIRRLGHENYQPSIHGHKFWRTSYLLMDYLSKSPPIAGARVIDVGCGWGLSGIYCAKAFDAQVTGVDADSHVFPYLQTHARINGVKIDTLEQRLELLTSADLKDIDLMIGSEICFWDSMEESVFELIKRAKDLAVGNIVLADPGRPSFMNLAQRCKHAFDAQLLEWYVRKPEWTYGHILLV